MKLPASRRAAGSLPKRRPASPAAFPISSPWSRPPRLARPCCATRLRLAEAVLTQPWVRVCLHWRLLRHDRRHWRWHLRGLARSTVALLARPGARRARPA